DFSLPEVPAIPPTGSPNLSRRDPDRSTLQRDRSEGNPPDDPPRRLQPRTITRLDNRSPRSIYLWPLSTQHLRVLTQSPDDSININHSFAGRNNHESYTAS